VPLRYLLRRHCGRWFPKAPAFPTTPGVCHGREEAVPPSRPPAFRLQLSFDSSNTRPSCRPLTVGRLNTAVCYRDETEHEAELSPGRAAAFPARPMPAMRAVSPERRSRCRTAPMRPTQSRQWRSARKTRRPREQDKRMIKHPDAAPKSRRQKRGRPAMGCGSEPGKSPCRENIGRHPEIKINLSQSSAVMTKVWRLRTPRPS